MIDGLGAGFMDCGLRAGFMIDSGVAGFVNGGL